MKPTEHNEMENKALKEHLASAALQMLAEGTDYENLAGTTCRFGYLFQIDGHGLEALFQLVTDTSPPRATSSCGSRSMRRSLKA